jgi:hypothetical protein
MQSISDIAFNEYILIAVLGVKKVFWLISALNLATQS